MKTLTHSRIDIIVPVFNEAEGIAAFHKRLAEAVAPLEGKFKIVYVDDGSTDATSQRLSEIAALDSRVTIIELSRNFGHQAALSAGLDQANADFVITLDGDGQHPPELIPEMLRLAYEGYEVVLTRRIEQEEQSFFKRTTSRFFYRLTNAIGDTRIISGGADFRLLARPALDALRQMHEYHRFLRGMVAWIGFRCSVISFTPGERLAGQSKYSLLKMIRLAMDAIFSFSLAPLYVGVSVGVLFLFLAVCEAIYVLWMWALGDQVNLARGWSSLMFVLLVVGGSLMITLGITGIYVGYIFQEVKHRPVYLVRRRHDSQTGAAGNSAAGDDFLSNLYE